MKDMRGDLRQDRGVAEPSAAQAADSASVTRTEQQVRDERAAEGYGELASDSLKFAQECGMEPTDGWPDY